MYMDVTPLLQVIYTVWLVVIYIPIYPYIHVYMFFFWCTKTCHFSQVCPDLSETRSQISDLRAVLERSGPKLSIPGLKMKISNRVLHFPIL